MRAKKIQEWNEVAQSLEELRSTMGEDTYRNFCRNKTVIDLDCIPRDIADTIVDKYKSQQNKDKGKTLPYLIDKRCNMLIESVQDFFPA